MYYWILTLFGNNLPDSPHQSNSSVLTLLSLLAVETHLTLTVCLQMSVKLSVDSICQHFVNWDSGHTSKSHHHTHWTPDLLVIFFQLCNKLVLWWKISAAPQPNCWNISRDKCTRRGDWQLQTLFQCYSQHLRGSWVDWRTLRPTSLCSQWHQSISQFT